jgi:hypothetical protein
LAKKLEKYKFHKAKQPPNIYGENEMNCIDTPTTDKVKQRKIIALLNSKGSSHFSIHYSQDWVDSQTVPQYEIVFEGRINIKGNEKLLDHPVINDMTIEEKEVIQCMMEEIKHQIQMRKLKDRKTKLELEKEIHQVGELGVNMIWCRDGVKLSIYRDVMVTEFLDLDFLPN